MPKKSDSKDNTRKWICPYCGKIVNPRARVGAQDDSELSANVVVDAVVNGCPNCRKIDHPTRAKVMGVWEAVGVCKMCKHRKYKRGRAVKCGCGG